ncbi:bifunctional nuclease family protein [Alienimonas chondri]|nr:bifunctional nuclease family protein [Alienimonas chondri]
MLVPMRLSRIILSDINEQQVLCLTEIADDGSDGERTFPILVGEFEAGSIHRAINGDAAPRPLTHDLLKSAIEELGAEVKDVVISHLQDHTYFAKVRLRRLDEDGPGAELDSRPSDAIALAVHHHPPRPIFVSDAVLDEVT